MTLFNPVWRVKIQGVEFTTYVLAKLSITSGRTNIYQQAQAGYCNIELINLEQEIINININDSITIELQDSTATLHPLGKVGTFPAEKVPMIRALARKYGLFWGGDYQQRKDEMHFEINISPKKVSELIKALGLGETK